MKLINGMNTIHYPYKTVQLILKKYFLLLFIICPAKCLCQICESPICDIENFEDSIIVTYKFCGAKHYKSPFIKDRFDWKYLGFGNNDQLGEPAVPFRNDTFIIPAGATAKISTIEYHYIDTIFPLSPAIEFPLDNQNEIKCSEIIKYEGFFPKDILICHEPTEYRNNSLLPVTIYPVQYAIKKNTVRAYSLIKYKITINNSQKNNSKESLTKGNDIISNSTLRIARNFNEWKSTHLQQIINNRNPQNAFFYEKSYLVISTTEYENALSEFVTWKKLKGFNVFVETRPRGQWTPDLVKNIIQTYFDTHNIEYLLIVGGTNDVPSANFSDFNIITDYPYGLPSSDGALPQIKRGRLPVNSTFELKTIVNKIIAYEKEPPTLNSFYDNATLCSYFQDEGSQKDGKEDLNFILFSETVKNHLVSQGKIVQREYYTPDTINPLCYKNGEPIPVNLKRPNFAWNGCANSIRQKINDGTFLVIHRDHGGKHVWRDPWFELADVTRLNNHNYTPVILNLDCEVGQYFDTDTCLAEMFLIKESGGCVGTIAASHNVQSAHDDVFGLGMIDAIWPGIIVPNNTFNDFMSISEEPIFDLGGIMDFGFATLNQTHDGTFYKELIKAYHCFGDPSMMTYTENPRHFNAPQIYVENDLLNVHLQEPECTISIYNRSTDTVSSYIGQNLIVPLEGDCVVCVDKHNYIPYIWDANKDVYIQNVHINNVNRQYLGRNIYIGNSVTPEIESGNVIISNSNIGISGKRLELRIGTKICNSNFKYIPR